MERLYNEGKKKNGKRKDEKEERNERLQVCFIFIVILFHKFSYSNISSFFTYIKWLSSFPVIYTF